MRKTLAIVLSALLLMTACCFALPVSAAEGTPINTAEEFAAMAVDGTYYLNADITLSASYANPFTGTLDGNGKTVTVSAPMFAEFNGTLKNITITGNISSTADTGAVAPLSNSGCVMNNVTNNVNISVITDTAVLVGGLIGNDLGTDIVSDYTGVTNNGDVYVDCETADHRVGGLVGFAHNAIFTRCTNNGDVTVIGADPFVGGLSGYAAGKPAAANTAEAYYCLNTGKISAQSPTNDGGDAGGLYGDIGCSSNLGFFRVFGCVNTGDVYGGYLSAGLVAYAYGILITVNVRLVTGCGDSHEGLVTLGDLFHGCIVAREGAAADLHIRQIQDGAAGFASFVLAELAAGDGQLAAYAVT